ncbi:MAG: hypothetical protein J3K34DRAFT_525068 [Monoraphidium minutum]|nr:MAG: hypothetical protein J3K34DRAFT_525068 [Monoraphidium minutum]
MLWPVDLSDGQEELEVAMELMAALGPAERAQLAEAMRGDVYGSMAGAMAQVDEDELRARFGDEVMEDPEVWDGAVLQAHMWGALRAQMLPEEADVLDKFFGDDWGSADDMDVGEFEFKLSQLTDDEKLALAAVMGRMDELGRFVASVDDTADAAQRDLERFLRQQQRAAAAGGGGGGGGGGGAYPGASPAMRAALEVLQGGETIVVDPREEDAARAARARRAEEEAAAAAAAARRRTREEEEGARRAAGGGGGGGARRWGEWGPEAGAGGEQEKSENLDSRLDSAIRHARATQAGVQEWGAPPSRHFQVLKSIHTRLSELEAMDPDNLPSGMAPSDFLAAFEFLNEQLSALLEGVDDITDAPTRSALLWMDARMSDPGTGDLEVTRASLEALGGFLAAAENLAALRHWAGAFGENHAQLNVPRLVEAAGLDGDDWFVRRDDRLAAAAAAEAAAAAGAAAGGALAPYVDDERVAWLAALDGDTLRFMADLERGAYSQDVLIKWSFHPTVGPRLASGEWYDEAGLPDLLQQIFAEAQQPWEGVDFELRPGGNPGGAARGRGGGARAGRGEAGGGRDQEGDGGGSGGFDGSGGGGFDDGGGGFDGSGGESRR